MVCLTYEILYHKKVIPDLIWDPATRLLPDRKTLFSPRTWAGWMPDQVPHDGEPSARARNQIVSAGFAPSPAKERTGGHPTSPLRGGRRSKADAKRTAQLIRVGVWPRSEVNRPPTGSVALRTPIADLPSRGRLEIPSGLSHTTQRTHP